MQAKKSGLLIADKAPKTKFITEILIAVRYQDGTAISKMDFHSYTVNDEWRNE